MMEYRHNMYLLSTLSTQIASAYRANVVDLLMVIICSYNLNVAEVTVSVVQAY